MVGLSVYEAEAYARWLAALNARPARLLREREWEAAARGREGRRFAYGDAEQPSAVNTFALRRRQPSPVGACLDGATPEGLQDLSGNVWAWTGSSWTTDHEPTRPSESAQRVVRGGSWNAPMVSARGACRYRFPLDLRLLNLGFRVCFPSPQSDL